MLGAGIEPVVEEPEDEPADDLRARHLGVARDTRANTAAMSPRSTSATIPGSGASPEALWSRSKAWTLSALGSWNRLAPLLSWDTTDPPRATTPPRDGSRGEIHRARRETKPVIAAINS